MFLGEVNMKLRSLIIDIIMEKVLNPFRYLSLRNAWCWGIVALILLTILSWLIGLPVWCGKSIWIAAAGITAAWLISAVIMYVVGAMVSKSKVRFVYSS